MLLLPGEETNYLTIDQKTPNKLVLPYVGGITTATVEYICYNHVVLLITHVDGVKTVKMSGVLHREDALFGIKDEDRLNELFSPGDVVYGRILSLGDTGHIVLSTADPAHGVIKAVDWKTLKDVKLVNGKFISNGVPLKRKIANALT
ncbi:exosome complex component CSL4 [Nematocida displodere]|uniref:Exosome complex component CSL4 n=1 Tax=Nematocida displodere TaxID=1805483 RepID=A0A177EB35_9MICR|nr:exosome complex component CSL4 [Nematocida displodere]